MRASCVAYLTPNIHEHTYLHGLLYTCKHILFHVYKYILTEHTVCKVNSGYVLQNNKSLAAMKVLVLPKVILFVTLLGLTTASNRDCPPWSFPDAENGTRCVCSSVLTNAVKCSKDTAILSISSCITYNSATEDTEVGPCP